MNVVFAGGGTGGHLYPALAIAEEIRRRRPGAAITFIGTDRKLEARVVPRHGFDFAAINVRGFRRSISPGNLLFPATLLLALWQSRRLLLRLKPDVVVGTGGYVCGPPLYVASRLRIPTLIQEQNSYPGVTTRLLAGRVNEVHITFELTRKYLRPGARITVSGNPVRSAIGAVSREEGARAFGFDPARKTLLVVGGSLGAASMNNAMIGALEPLLADGIQVLWSTGEQELARIQEAVKTRTAANPKLAVILPYIADMEHAYAACDLAVCRAGATTLAELTKAGVPSVLVPYPFAAADHQRLNAQTMVEPGAALLVADDEIGTGLLPTVRKLLADSGRLQAMAAHAKSLGKPDATQRIARSILNLAGEGHDGAA